MAAKDCFEVFRNLAGKHFSKAELKAAFKRLQDEQGAAQDAMESAHDRMTKLGEIIGREQEMNDARKAFVFFREMKNQRRDLKTVRGFKNKNGGLKLGLLSVETGTQRGVEGSRDGLRTEMMVLNCQLLDMPRTEMKEAGVLAIFNSKHYEVPLADEVMGLGVGKDPHMATLGSIIRKNMEKSTEMYKKQGIEFEDLPERITRNFHNKGKLDHTSEDIVQREKDLFKMSKNARREKAYLRWRSIIEPLLHPKNTKRGSVALEDLTEKEKDTFFRKVYQSLTSAQSLQATGQSLRLRIKQSRVLRWKDGASMVEYNRIYGKGTLHEAILSEWRTTAKQLTLLNRMGENPAQYLDRLVKIIQNDPSLKMNITPFEMKAVRNTLKAAMGTQDDPAPTVAGVGGNIRSALNILKLGAVQVAVLNDVVPVSQELERIYGSFLGGMTKGIQAFAKNKSLAESKVLGKLLSSYATQEVGMQARFFSSGAHTGVLSKLQSLAFKYNGLSAWDSGWRRVIAAAQGEHLAMNRKLSFEDIVKIDKKFGEKNVRIFKAYNISGEEWDAFRKAPIKMENGTEYLLPESAADIPDETIRDLMKKEGRQRISQTAVDARREALADKFMGYILDRVEHGIFRPDFNDTAQLLRGTTSGSFMGELARFFAQYKMYQLSYMKRSWGNAIYGGGADSLMEGLLTSKGDHRAMMQLVVAGTFYGYLSVVAGALILGESPPSPFKVATILESMIKGGAMGLYGDYIFRPAGGYNRSVLDNLGGPAGAEFRDLFNIGQAPINGGKITHMAWHFTRGNLRSMVPWYLKYISDATFFNQVNDAMSPGATQRHIARLRARGQHYIFPPKL